ncbi:outer membrane porin GjpA [Mycobacterium sp. ACS4331]|uniref:outer membrane porin GjpA n=1 Tax=Mycobacterium sp. ACS4331 TaxID=1834121 RepID=UPI0008022B0C|nr:outer membrane porin GjpA [Mycobacterium sp. ACS4331]OBF17101.1 hypothetical protein A5727_12305 [Mycobacterium sp. ACS4331]
MSALRSYATAGVALMGAGAIAVTPITASPPAVETLPSAVQLAAAVDPITPLRELFNNSEVNLAGLANALLEAPAPVLQQVIVNQLGHLGELPDVEGIVGQIGTNLKQALTALVAKDLSTLTPGAGALWELLPLTFDVPPELQPVLDFTTNYLSGVLLGLVGPAVAPVLALGGSITSIIDGLNAENPDGAAALNTLINIPATMTDAFLNGGQTIDLSPLLDALGVTIDVGGIGGKLGLTLGGVLSPGGSLLDAVNLDLVIGGEVIPGVTGQGVGAIGSMIGLTKAIAKAIGWDGTGNPLAPSTPAPLVKSVDDPGAVPTSVLRSPLPSAVTSADDTSDGGARGGNLPTLTLVKEGAASTTAGEKSDVEPTQPGDGKNESDPHTRAADHFSNAVRDAGQKVSTAISNAGKGVKNLADTAAKKRAEKRAERRAAKAQSSSASGD